MVLKPWQKIRLYLTGLFCQGAIYRMSGIILNIAKDACAKQIHNVPNSLILLVSSTSTVATAPVQGVVNVLKSVFFCIQLVNSAGKQTCAILQVPHPTWQPLWQEVLVTEWQEMIVESVSEVGMEHFWTREGRTGVDKAYPTFQQWCSCNRAPTLKNKCSLALKKPLSSTAGYVPLTWLQQYWKVR